MEYLKCRYDVKIEISGACSEFLGDIAKRIAMLMEHPDFAGGYRIVLDIPDKEPPPYDGLISDETVLIKVLEKD